MVFKKNGGKMSKIINNDKYNQLRLLREERLNKAKDLYNFVDELRREMLESGQMLSNKNLDPLELAFEYARLLEMKKNFENNEDESINSERIEVILRAISNLKIEMCNISNNSQIVCDFEEYVKNNLKYLDLNKISKEVQNFNPFTYNMRNELFYLCFINLNNVVSSNVREENILYYEELINHFISIQSTIISLLDVKIQIEKEEREKKLIQEDKLSPAEALYIENYMNILREKLGLFILNTMKQNMIILSQKIYFSDSNKQSISILADEFNFLHDDLIKYIGSYDANQSLCALPCDYARSILPQISLISNFVLESDIKDYIK